MPTTDEAMTPAIHKPALGAAAAAFMAKKHQMLIDGKWVDARSGQTFAVEDPQPKRSLPTSRQEIRRISILRSQPRAAPLRPVHGPNVTRCKTEARLVDG